MQSYDVQSIIDKYSKPQPFNSYKASQQNLDYRNRYQWTKGNQYDKINKSYQNKNEQVKSSYLPKYPGSPYDHSYHNKSNLNQNFSYQINLPLAKSQYSNIPTYQSKNYDVPKYEFKNNINTQLINEKQIYGQRPNTNIDLLKFNNQIDQNKYSWDNSNIINQNNYKIYQHRNIAKNQHFYNLDNNKAYQSSNITHNNPLNNQNSKPFYSSYWENKISTSTVGKPINQPFKQQNNVEFDPTKTSQSQVFRVNPSTFYADQSNNIYNQSSPIYPLSNNPINQQSQNYVNYQINQNKKYEPNQENYFLPKSSYITQTPKFNMPQIRLNQGTTYNGLNSGTAYNELNSGGIYNGLNSNKSINSLQYINNVINNDSSSIKHRLQGVPSNQPSTIISLKKSTITYPSGLSANPMNPNPMNPNPMNPNSMNPNPMNPNNQIYKRVSGPSLAANKQGFIPLHKTQQQSNDYEIDKFQEPERKVYNTFELKDNITYTKQEEFQKNNKCLLGAHRVTYDLKTNDDDHNKKILGNWC